MGVLKSPRQKVRIEDVPVDYRDFIFDSDSEFGTDSEGEINSADARAIREVLAQDEKRRKKSRQERVLKRFQRAAGQIGNDGLVIKPRMGARKRRRVENAHLIMNHADHDDIVDDFSDMVPHTVTAFTRLFLDKTSMKTWQSFMEKSEEEQEKFIEDLDQGCTSTASEDDFEHVTGGKPIKLPKGYFKMTNEEKRSYHPAFSARACFERLDNKFKSALTRKRGVPYHMVDDLEHKLRSFYQAQPNGVWIDLVEGSHTRIYVHAIANFLSLSSSSMFGDSGGKMIEIRNPRKFFNPPYQYLIPYLHQRQGKSVCIDDGVNF
jgi:hypothetical protein